MFDLADLITAQIIKKNPKLMNKGDALRMLGIPTHEGHPKKNVHILKYKNWELTFYKDYLCLLAVYNNETDQSNDPQIFKMSVSMFLDWINKLNVDWEIEDKYPTAMDQAQITFKSGAIAIIDNSRDRIDSIMLKPVKI